MDNILVLYKKLAISIFGVYCFMFVLGISGILYRGVYPPPLSITLFLFIGFPGIIIGAVFHPALFLLLNLYLVRRQKKGLNLSLFRTFLPSVIYIGIITVLSLSLWLGGEESGVYLGLKYQGLDYVVVYGILNAIVLSGLISTIIILMYRSLKRKIDITGKTLMVYNFLIHISFMLVLFPYLGETP